MDAGAIERLVGVDVPKPRDDFLVQQRCLDRPLLSAQPRQERLPGERLVQRLRSQRCEETRQRRQS